MRTAFIQTLTKNAEQDQNIYLLAGDVGFSVIEEFQQKFPQRFINIGIAEQSMIGIAAGLAMAGKNVFVYSIVPFVTMRCFEQVRNDLCYQQLPVKIVGNGGGLDYGALGATHHAIEDIAIMRSLPDMAVLAPGSRSEAVALTNQLCSYTGPAYLRLSRSDNKVPYQAVADIAIGKPVIIIPHDTHLLISTGNMLDQAYELCLSLRAEGNDFGLVSMPTVKPLNLDWLPSTLEAVFTLEEHNICGGLGEAVGSYIAQQQKFNTVKFKPFAIPDQYCHRGGKSEFLRDRLLLNRKFVLKVMMDGFV